MSSRNTIEGWLTGLGGPTGPKLTLDETGSVGIVLASGLVLTVEVEESGIVHLHCGLQRLREDATRIVVLEEALVLNLFTRATEGATLGLDRKSDTLVLSMARDISFLTREAFAALLGSFAEAAERLQGRLATLATPASGLARTSFAEGERIDLHWLA